jgi:hypothetical protein
VHEVEENGGRGHRTRRCARGLLGERDGLQGGRGEGSPEPESTDEGAQFDCTGTDGEGTEFTGIGTIIGEKSYRVDILHPRGEEIVAAMND